MWGNKEKEASNFDTTGYPIVKDKINLKAFITTGAFQPNVNQMTYFKKTGGIYKHSYGI